MEFENDPDIFKNQLYENYKESGLLDTVKANMRKELVGNI